MATKDTEKFLRNLNKFVGKNVRSRLDKFYTKVTLTNTSLGQGFKEGYEMVKANRPNDTWPEITDKTWNVFGGAAVDKVHAYASMDRTWPVVIKYKPKKLLQYGARRDIKKAYRIAKQEGVRQLNNHLKKAGGRSLNTMKQDQDAGLDIKAASQSEIGMFKSESHRSHQGVSTVGAAQMSAAMKFLELTKDFAGFAKSELAKDIMEVYPDIEAVFTTTGTKKKGAQVNLNENQEVSIGLGPRSLNKAGSEAYDWKNLKKPFEDAVRAYLDTIPIADRSGSKSIRKNALDQGEFVVIDTLVNNIAGATVNAVTQRSQRKRKQANNTTTGRSKAPKASRKKAKSRGQKAVNVKQSNHAQLTTLLGIINAKLPETVAKNMGTPMLNYRTGRFSNSTRAVAVTPTPQGHPSVAYTYQRDPYGVYETSSGSRFADADRDPRKIIDMSIREIAAKQFTGRLFTRRV